MNGIGKNAKSNSIKRNSKSINNSSNNNNKFQEEKNNYQSYYLIIKLRKQSITNNNNQSQQQPHQQSLQKISSQKSLHSHTSHNNPKIQSNPTIPTQLILKFPYNKHTQIKNLISFLHKQLQNNLFYFKCNNNIYIDYILNLKEFKIKQLVEYLKKQKNEYQEDNNSKEKKRIKSKNKNIRRNSKQSANNVKQQEIIEISLEYCQYQPIQYSNYLKNFQLIKCVGSGGFSKVYLVRGYGKLMAMKVISKQYILQNDKANIINNQKNILTLCSDHPFITKLYSSFQTKNFLIFVMEFCNGGELFNLLRKVRRMTQQNAKFYFLETLSAIAYLHRKGIVYRDIKPQNIILDYQGHVRLADYGLSKIMQETREAKTYSFCGSAQYMAPQMLLKKGHSYDIDFYCLGALLYELVIGLPPYYSRNQNQLFSNIIHNDLQFPQHVNLSAELKSFLQNLLQKDSQNRYKTLEQILSHPWLKNIKMEDILMKKIKPPYKTDMFQYNFDDNDFAQQQKEITERLMYEQNYHTFQNLKFNDFFYEEKEIMELQNIIKIQKQKGFFIRTSKNNIGQFNATSQNKIQSTTNINANNVQKQQIPKKQSRASSIDFQSNSFTHIRVPSSVENTRRIQIKSPTSHIKYSQNQQGMFLSPKNSLNVIRNVGKITPNKQVFTRSNKSLNSSLKKPINQGYSNIYTQKSNIYYISKTPQNPYISTILQPAKSYSYIRQPNYYSVQKPTHRGQNVILDIQNLKLKNHRNYSVQSKNDNRTSHNINNRSQAMLYANYTQNIKPTINSYQLHKGYLQSFRDKNAPTKVKKVAYRNGQKFSVNMNMLNNVHYRN